MQLLEIERHKEAIHVLPVTASLIASLRETARLVSTHYSTQIEGNALTQAEVTEVFKGKKGGFPGRERDQREVINYFRALAYVEEQLKIEASISKNLLQKIHSFVLTGSEKGTPYEMDKTLLKMEVQVKLSICLQKRMTLNL